MDMRMTPTNSDGEERGIPVVDFAGLIDAIIRLDIVVGKGVPPVVEIFLVHDARVVVGRVRLVERLHIRRVEVLAQQRGSVERRRQPGDEGLSGVVGVFVDLEWAGAAAEDVGGAGLRKNVRVEDELPADRAARDRAGAGLRIDAYLCAGVRLQHAPGVLFVVACE